MGHSCACFRFEIKALGSISFCRDAALTPSRLSSTENFTMNLADATTTQCMLPCLLLLGREEPGPFSESRSSYACATRAWVWHADAVLGWFGGDGLAFSVHGMPQSHQCLDHTGTPHSTSLPRLSHASMLWPLRRLHERFWLELRRVQALIPMLVERHIPEQQGLRSPESQHLDTKATICPASPGSQTRPPSNRTIDQAFQCWDSQGVCGGFGALFPSSSQTRCV